MGDIVRVKNLVKRYKKAKRNAVDGITFSIKKGSFFALLGPNGAGKTTTVSVLSTTLAKTAGEVMIDGYNLDKHPSEIRKKLGVIFQKPSLDINLTAEENIRFHVFLYGLYAFRPVYALMPADYKNKVQSLSKLLNLKNAIFQPIRTFSGGMKRKLEIIRSLMHEPEIIILDEPTSGLDPLSRRNLWEYIDGIRKRSDITVLLTTHYLDEAENAQTVCIIDQGKIISIGSPQMIKRNLIREYLILDTENRRELEGQLKRLNLPTDGNFPVKVYLDKQTAQEVIRKIDVPLTMLKVHAPTLEEAYLEIIKKYESRD